MRHCDRLQYDLRPGLDHHVVRPADRAVRRRRRRPAFTYITSRYCVGVSCFVASISKLCALMLAGALHDCNQILLAARSRNSSVSLTRIAPPVLLGRFGRDHSSSLGGLGTRGRA